MAHKNRLSIEQRTSQTQHVNMVVRRRVTDEVPTKRSWVLSTNTRADALTTTPAYASTIKNMTLSTNTNGARCAMMTPTAVYASALSRSDDVDARAKSINVSNTPTSMPICKKRIKLNHTTGSLASNATKGSTADVTITDVRTAVEE